MSEAVLPQVLQPVATPTSDTLPIGAEFKDLSLEFFEKLAQEHYLSVSSLNLPASILTANALLSLVTIPMLTRWHARLICS
jgi:hypothetical protein